MGTRLSGKVVADFLQQKNAEQIEQLKAAGITPTLGIIRVGERADDVYYENSIIKNCEKIGLAYHTFRLDEQIDQLKLEQTVREVAANAAIHGIFFFSPLPKSFDEAAVRACIPAAKDIDCLTMDAAGKVYVDDKSAFPPCTPAAVMELLNYYEIPLQGANVAVLGRSLVVGKPLAMLLLRANATVTICHSRTQNLPAVCQNADILIAAVGRAKMVDATYVRAGQTVIDVGINNDPDNEGKMCGDVDYEAVLPIVDSLTPVPGGIGSVTTAVLLKHVVQAAQKFLD